MNIKYNGQVGNCFTCEDKKRCNVYNLFPSILECEYLDCFRSVKRWHLDTHSTILSRKHSYHKRVGKLMYVKTKYERS